MDMNIFRTSMPPFGGMKIVSTEAATALPSGKPTTDDMRAMVDHFHDLGLIQRKPAAFKAGGSMFVHPVFMEEIRKRFVDHSENLFMSALYGEKPSNTFKVKTEKRAV